MNETSPPTLPKGPEPTQTEPKRGIAPRILLGCGIAVVIILALVVGSMVFFFATAKKGHDLTMAEYVEYFETHRDCFHRMAELEDAGKDPNGAPCANDLDAMAITSEPLCVTMYMFFTSDFRAFVYRPNLEPSPLVEDLDAARKENPNISSAFAPMGDGWYLQYSWD